MANPRKRGLQVFREVHGTEMAEAIEGYIASDEFGVKQAEWTLDWAFGSVWASDKLDRKLRSCAVIGMLIGSRASEELKSHVKLGLVNGLTRTELEEIFYSAIPYAGFPAANNAKTAMLDVFAELDSSD